MQAVYPMALTCNEFKRIQNDDEEVLRLIKLDADNATKIHIMNLKRKVE